MIAYFNMPTSEFVAQLRDIAINANARPAVIDCIDAISDGPTEKDIQKRVDDAVEKAIDETRENEWERCVVALDAAMLTRKGKPLLGLTMDQIVALQNALQKVRPE